MGNGYYLLLGKCESCEPYGSFINQDLPSADSKIVGYFGNLRNGIQHRALAGRTCQCGNGKTLGLVEITRKPTRRVVCLGFDPPVSTLSVMQTVCTFQGPSTETSTYRSLWPCTPLDSSALKSQTAHVSCDRQLHRCEASAPARPDEPKVSPQACGNLG